MPALNLFVTLRDSICTNDAISGVNFRDLGPQQTFRWKPMHGRHPCACATTCPCIVLGAINACTLSLTHTMHVLQMPCLLDAAGVRSVNCSGCGHLKPETLFPQWRRGWKRQCCVCLEMDSPKTPQDKRVLEALPRPPPTKPVFICGRLPSGAPWPGRLVGIRCAVYLPPTEEGGPYIPCPGDAFDNAGLKRHPSGCCEVHRHQTLHRMDASVIAENKYCSDCKSWLDPDCWSPALVTAEHVGCEACAVRRQQRRSSSAAQKKKAKEAKQSGKPPEVYLTLHDKRPTPDDGLKWLLRYNPKIPAGMVLSESSKWPSRREECRVADCREDAINMRAVTCSEHVNHVLCLQTQDGCEAVEVHYCRSCQKWRSVAGFQDDGRCHHNCFKSGKNGSKAPIRGDTHLKVVLQHLADTPHLRSAPAGVLASELGLGTCDHAADAEAGRCRFTQEGVRCPQKINKKHASLMCRDHCHNVVLRRRGADGGGDDEKITWYCPCDYCQRVCSIDGVGLKQGGYVCAGCHRDEQMLLHFSRLARARITADDADASSGSEDDGGDQHGQGHLGAERDGTVVRGPGAASDAGGCCSAAEDDDGTESDLCAASDGDDVPDFIVRREDADPDPVEPPREEEQLPAVNAPDASGQFKCRHGPCGKLLTVDQAIDGFCITCLAQNKRCCSALDAAVLITIPGTLHQGAGASAPLEIQS